MVEARKKTDDGDFHVPFELQKQFSPQEITEMIHCFKIYDANQDGTIHQDEFKQVMIDIGRRDIQKDQLQEKFKSFDLDNDGVLNWTEYLEMFKGIKEEQADVFKQVMETKAGQVIQSVSDSGTTHSYPVEEKLCYVKIINDQFKDDEEMQLIVPINEDSDDIFSALQDGLLMCKLINMAQTDAIDMRAVNKKKNLNIYQIKENLNVVISSSKAIGCVIPGIKADCFLEKKPHLILSIMGQVIKMIVTNKINLKDCPEIMQLAQEGEELKDLTKLPPEHLLIRWVNYHLAREK